MQTDEYIARRVQLEHFLVSKGVLDQRHAISEARNLATQLGEQADTSTIRLHVVDFDYQVAGIACRKGVPKCFDRGKRVFSRGIACGFENAHKRDLVDGNAKLRAVGVDFAKILQRMLCIDGRRSRYVSLERASQILRARHKHVELFKCCDPDLWNDRKLPPEISCVHDVTTQLDPTLENDVR